MMLFYPKIVHWLLLSGGGGGGLVFFGGPFFFWFQVVFLLIFVCERYATIWLEYSTFLFNSVYCNSWWNNGHGMYYPYCGMMHIQDPLLLIGMSNSWGGGSRLLNKTFPFHSII